MVRVVAVDGPAGSGKSTFAERLSDRLAGRGVVLHLDDMYAGWTGLTGDLDERVLDQVLSPLAAGRDARWQRYDWAAGAFDGWVDLPAPEVLVIEGCGAGNTALSAYLNLLVWIEAAADERVRRGRARAGEEQMQHWMRWTELERELFATERTRERADLRFRTS
jgi:uridine kinase